MELVSRHRSSLNATRLESPSPSWRMTMNDHKRKSRKQSDAKSRRDSQHEDLVFFLDRSLGRHVIADKLRAVQVKVEVHDNHLPASAPDEDWIALVGSRGWVAFTKDKNIRYRAAELESIRRNSARVIVIRSKDMTGGEIGDLVVRARPRIAGFVANTPAPFVAGLYRDGSLKALHIDRRSGQSSV